LATLEQRRYTTTPGGHSTGPDAKAHRKIGENADQFVVLEPLTDHLTFVRGVDESAGIRDGRQRFKAQGIGYVLEAIVSSWPGRTC
jgi:hypothetical protein